MNTLVKATTHIIFSVICFISLYSCYSSKKTRAAKLVATAKEVIAKETGEISKVNSSKDQQLEAENIDTTINNRIVTKLAKYSGEINEVLSKADKTDSLLSSGKKFRRNYKSFVAPALVEMDSFTRSSPVRLAKYNMIKDGIAQSKKRLYELAAFLAPVYM